MNRKGDGGAEQLSVTTQAQPGQDWVDELEKEFDEHVSAVATTVQAFFRGGEAVELRYRTKSEIVGSGVYTDHRQFVEDASRVSDDAQTEAVWFNLNEIPAALSSNTHRLGASAVKNEHITRRKLILVDVEARRPEEFKHDSATHQEKQEASAEAKKVGTVLARFGIPYVTADSGNGFHLLVRVDLPCNEETDALARNFLVSLQQHVPTAKLDLAVHNRSRVAKLYGTQTRKGRNLPDRPWRVSALLQDCAREPVSADRLQRVINAAPGAAVKPIVRRDDVAGRAVVPDFDIKDFLRHYGLNARSKGNYYATDICIMAGRNHSGAPDKSAFYFDGQRFGWNCFSSDCANFTIGDVITKLNKNHARYPKPIWPEKARPLVSAGCGELPVVDEQVLDDPTKGPPDWPTEALEGDYLAEYAHLLTDGTRVPPQFVREQVKMVLGALHEGLIGFPSHTDLGTRHYVQLVTDGPQGCKDESWKRILGTSDKEVSSSPWSKILSDRGIRVLDGSRFGSGQYIAKELEEKGCCIAVLGEGRELWEKNSQQASTLETAMLKLYDGTSHWTGSLTNKRHGSDDIHLSLTSFFTLDSYRSSFSSKGSAGGGYLSRNVIAYSNRLPYLGDWPDRDRGRERKAVDRILGLVPDQEDSLLEELVPPVWIPQRTSDAWELFDCFKREIEDSDYVHRDHIARLVDLTSRDLLIRVRYSGNHTITREMVERAVAWGRHQLSLRVALWPFDRGSQVEAMTGIIVRALNRHPSGLTESKLRDFCHVDRPGSGGQETFNRAFHAMKVGKRIKQVGRTRKGTFLWGLTCE